MRDLTKIIKNSKNQIFWSDFLGKVTASYNDDRDDYPIIIQSLSLGRAEYLTKFGQFYLDNSCPCSLWYSKDDRSWNDINIPIELEVGDNYLTKNNEEVKILFKDENRTFNYLGVININDQWELMWFNKQGLVSPDFNEKYNIVSYK